MSRSGAQCSACGRVSPDWSAPDSVARENGSKVAQRPPIEDRLRPYRDWRWRLGGAYVADLDQVEYAIVDGEVVPVAVLEMTRVDGDRLPPPSYFESIRSRIMVRDAQGRVAVALAARLGVRAYVVAFRWDCSEFWVCGLTDDTGWKRATPAAYERWIRRLRSSSELATA